MTRFERFIANDDNHVHERDEDGAPMLPLIGATALCFLLTFLAAFVLFGL